MSNFEWRNGGSIVPFGEHVDDINWHYCGLGRRWDLCCANSRSVVVASILRIHWGFTAAATAVTAENGAQHSGLYGPGARLYGLSRSRIARSKHPNSRPWCLSRRYQSLAHSSVEIYETHESNSILFLRHIILHSRLATFLCVLHDIFLN